MNILTEVRCRNIGTVEDRRVLYLHKDGCNLTTNYREALEFNTDFNQDALLGIAKLVSQYFNKKFTIINSMRVVGCTCNIIDSE